ncbi:MAG TPA: hypothetical protein VJV03_11880 [Pyrinomonadaceae bacterium]|nr:hypothetical protein [Pyrinomonadaceae bacterium]
MAGYSGTPLAKKLGIKEDARVRLVNAPDGFEKELGELPPGVDLSPRGSKPFNLVLLFVKSESALKKEFSRYAQKITRDGMIWVAWPKKSSGMATDLLFDNVQKTGLKAGLVDVKICAVNEIWSGLKFVYRLKDR